jgi:hypothetical protein
MKKGAYDLSEHLLLCLRSMLPSLLKLSDIKLAQIGKLNFC